MRTFSLFLLISLLFACEDGNYVVTEEFAGGGKMLTTMAPDSVTMIDQTLTFASGEVNFQGKFLNNKRNGKWEAFFQNGNRWSENNYVEGVFHGPYLVWYENGQLRIKGQYDMGKKVGLWELYDESGKVISIEEPNSNQE